MRHRRAKPYQDPKGDVKSLDACRERGEHVAEANEDDAGAVDFPTVEPGAESSGHRPGAEQDG